MNPNSSYQSRNWLHDQTFNLLIDYYPEVPVRPYGSGATRENLLRWLRPLDLGYVCIYAKGHSGRTTYQSELGTAHPMLAHDMPALFREVADELDIKLVLYYSGLVDGIAALRHPDWCMRNHDGSKSADLDASKKSIEGDWQQELVRTFMLYPLCPLSDYFEEWVHPQIREMLAYNPDGIWIDGDWPGPCYCHRCEERFRRETGHTGPLPIAGDGTPAGRAYREFFVGLTREWRSRLRNAIQTIDPNCLYSSGNINTHCASTPALDWRSGDFFSPRLSRFMQSCAMRRYTNQGVPYDAYTVDTAFVHHLTQRRSRTKTMQRMLQEGAGVLANGGMWGYWTYPMPNGALIPSRMKQAAHAREWTRQREETCHGTQAVAWTAILEIDQHHTIANDMHSWGACKALIELHRSPQIIDDSQLAPDMPHDLLIIANQDALSDAPPELFSSLRTWIENGGKLLTTGSTVENPAMQELLGIRLKKKAVLHEGHVLLPDGMPASMHDPWDNVEPTEAESWFPLYRSWDDQNIDMRVYSTNYPMDGVMDEENPHDAGFPAATIRRLGKGVAAHVPCGIFQNYWSLGEAPLRRWIGQMLDELQPEPLFQTDALCFVEVALREKNGRLLIHLVNGNPGRDTAVSYTSDLTVDDIPPVGPIQCRVRCAVPPETATLEPGGEKLPFTFQDGVLEVSVPRLEIHCCVTVAPWNPA
jgi:hypothetical protein